MLPSQVAREATTFDLTVIEAGRLWEQHQHRLARGEKPELPPAPELSQQEMQQMIKQAREKPRRKK
jgi:hypothetical protein